MKRLFERLWTRESPRRAVPRPTAIRPQLEALETRLTPSTAAVQTAVLKVDGELDLYNTQTGVFQVLSPVGTIGSVSAAQTAGGQTVVFAVAINPDAAGNLNTLWEYNAANGGWSEVSTGYFQQVSAATNAAGDAVVFGVLGQGAFSGYANSLWEFSNGGWRDLAGSNLLWPPIVFLHGQTGQFQLGQLQNPPGAVQSVSAVGTAQGEVAFAIASNNQSLYEYTPSGGWSLVSTGTFQQVSAGLDANGQATAFGVLTTGLASSDVWEFDNNAWTALTGPDVKLPPGLVSEIILAPTEYSVTAGRNGEVFIANSTNLEEDGGPSGHLSLSYFGTLEFAQVSATQTSSGADVVFGTLSDGSLWEYTNGGWTELLSGGVASTATPL